MVTSLLASSPAFDGGLDAGFHRRDPQWLRRLTPALPSEDHTALAQADPLKLAAARALAHVGDTRRKELIERTAAARGLLLGDRAQARDRLALGGLEGGLEKIDLAREVVVHAAAADARAGEDLLGRDLVEVALREQVAHRAHEPLASSRGGTTTFVIGARRLLGWGIDIRQRLS